MIKLYLCIRIYMYTQGRDVAAVLGQGIFSLSTRLTRFRSRPTAVIISQVKVTFQITHFTINSENQNCLALTSYHSNVFTFIPPSSEGRGSEAWESSINVMLLLHPK
jgi:hypothetical protein